MLTTPFVILSCIAPADVIIIDRDNIEITESCTIQFESGTVISDADDNGILQITGDDIEVTFPDEVLRGSSLETDPDQYSGIAMHITGERVTIRNAHLAGFKGGIVAKHANDLIIEDCSLDDNFRQRLKSTPEQEDASDWLRPHDNANNEWLHNYGAAIFVEESENITVRRNTIRNTQNGIVLDTVKLGRIYDNDASFLSGWGCAMWKSQMNIISRNAFDFCVRGYSHKVYNRGQDSAGLLMFEQNSDNIVIENSITHGGDGIFAFAGNEALQDESRRVGNNRNVFLDNDLSYAVAHGLELTFSFDNIISGNRFDGNAICGIWGGYSQDTTIANNTFYKNGDMPYGLERGGINIEHGIGNVIVHNLFKDNECGIHLWWDNDEHLLKLPWATANEPGELEEGQLPHIASKDNVIAGNEFLNDVLAIQLRGADDTYIFDNTFLEVGEEMSAEESKIIRESFGRDFARPIKATAIGDTTPIGARAKLRGRQHIEIDEWGPIEPQEVNHLD